MVTTKIGTPFAFARWEVGPGNEAAFIETWDTFARWTAAHQPGAIMGVLLQDTENRRHFVSTGPWEKPEQLAEWRKTPEFREAFARFRELCTAIEPQDMECVAVREHSV